MTRWRSFSNPRGHGRHRAIRSEKSNHRTRRTLRIEQLDSRQMMAVGPQLIGITPNDGTLLQNNDVRNVAPVELTFRFDEEQRIDPNSLAGIRFTRAGLDGAFGQSNDVVITPGFIGIGNEPNTVIARFASALPDDLYRIDIVGSGSAPLKNLDNQPFNMGVDRSVTFRLDLGAQVVAIVPQPITRNAQGVLQQATNQIVVYFNKDDLRPATATNPAFYQLIFTNSTVTNTDDVRHQPTSVNYNSTTDTAVLTFAAPLHELSTGVGTYRLRIGNGEALPVPPTKLNVTVDPGSSYATATDLGAIGNQGILLSSEIEAQNFALPLPGSDNDPGHPSTYLNQNRHLLVGADNVSGVSTIAYNFRDEYGEDASGNRFRNLITERQKERTREIFALYAQYLGVQFVETADQGFSIVTGEFRALNPAVPTGVGNVLSLAGTIPNFGPTAIMEAAEQWQDGFGENWFREAMRQIGHLLGLGDTFDLPLGTIQGSDPRLDYTNITLGFAPDSSRILPTVEPIFPGDHDIVHGQHLYRPDSKDIDLYRFTLSAAGQFTAETIAERLADSSLLDSVLRLYRETNTGRELIAQNDDYFSEDAFLRLALTPGTYYLGVSASGNNQYDPVIADTGFGGTTQGVYDLRLQFRPDIATGIVDTSGTLFDGDADGRPGGVHDYWFNVQTPARTRIVDKAFTGTGTGTLASPYNNVAAALSAAVPGDIVRIVGNGGADGNLDTLADNRAYQIGFSGLGAPLADGTTMEVPRGVTVMVDAGAIFHMRRSVMAVGSSSVTVDRSGGALQVLGTPTRPVTFTSADDQTIGLDTNPIATTPQPGHWGGIVVRNDLDRAAGRAIAEDQGIFLNTINQADMRYGGGSVLLQSVSGVINPVHMIDARPTVTFSTITRSADAAMSATPNSFEETNFHAPAFQATSFTSDYDRVGPEIHGNQILNNSINGLFVRVPTVNSVLQPMTVAGRWDDTDIVHIVTENLTVQGTPGGPVLQTSPARRQARLDASLVVDPGTVVKFDGGRLEIGMGATLMAEGTATQSVVFTSLQDNRFGFGGTSDTNNSQTDSSPAAGDWGGIILRHTSTGSIDHAVVAYGGGINRIEGTFTGFNAVEVHQAEARITNSVFESNGDGFGGQAPLDRFGRGFNSPGTIFVRASQPVVVNNVFRDNDGPVIDIDANSLNHRQVADTGRSTGLVAQFSGFVDNQGPLVRRNRLGNNQINGMDVRGGTLTTESVWDDTDIVHVLRDTIYVPDLHTYGGLRLESSANESLVVKILGTEAGFVTAGIPGANEERIGGRLHVVGQPGKPVVLTSLRDDLVGAGLDPDGKPQTDTDNEGRPLRDTTQQNRFRIDLNFGPRILARPEMVAAYELAARLWEQRIQDPATITIDVEISEESDFIYRVETNTVLLDYNEVRTAMIDDAGDHESLVERIPTFENFRATLPQDPLNPFTISSQMSVPVANAIALGFDPSTLASPASQFNPEEKRSGSITIDSNTDQFDFNRSDSTLHGRRDFVSVGLSTIGTVLGFETSIQTVIVGLDDPTATRTVNVTPMDLFRLAPGEGQDNFATAPRLLNPRIDDHVLYDGGKFDPTGIPVERLERGDVPLSVPGLEPGFLNDGYWLPTGLTGRRPLGVNTLTPAGNHEADVFFNPSVSNITEVDVRALDLLGWDIVGGGSPGDWQGISVTQYSHDRNVSTVTERELPDAVAPGSNASPSTAQFVGNLASHEYSGDENQRLGIEIHGVLNQRADVDVYSFTGTAGTKIVLDIDRTTMALDSVVELIDGNGVVLARSDNSVAEAAGAPTLVGTITRQPLAGTDHFTTNPRDAGMRVTLPGPVGSVNTYHVRVRSSSPTLDSNLLGGLTQGQYQLQIRLRDLDETPGTSVSLADIRYADVGVYVVGMPGHSPLAGGYVEDTSFNDLWEEVIIDADGNRITGVLTDDDPPVIFPFHQLPPEVSPQNLGNLVGNDRAAISLFGNLDSSTDLDWYQFHIDFATAQGVNGITNLTQETAGVVFDIDYADGIARPDTVLAVYDNAGRLLFYSDSSNVAADRPVPLGNNGLSDLSRGSVGVNDPYIGPVVLNAGQEPGPRFPGFAPRFGVGTYFVAISSAAQVPAEIASGATLTEVIPGLTGRGQSVTGTSGFTLFDVNPNAPANAVLTGPYQLEIRFVSVPDGGFDTSNATIADANRDRDQGQVVIDSTRITDSMQWGIMLDGGTRDLPFYGGSFSTQRPFSQYNSADYVPHGGAPRSLAEINRERLAPGVVIQNNVISGGNEGGVHVMGDPNGYVLQTFDLLDLDGASEALELPLGEGGIDGRRFTIRDIHGNEETFEFEIDGGVAAGNIPIRVDLDYGTSPLPATTELEVADEIETAIRASRLDVRVFHGEVDTLFIEGATFLDEPNVGSRSALLAIGAPFPLLERSIAQQGAVPFARLVNNTLVGRGGDLFDGIGAHDVGILIEDYSSPTLLNNIVANFGTALKADLSSTDRRVDRPTYVSSQFSSGVFFRGQPPGDSVDLAANGSFTPTDFVGQRPSVIGGTVYQGNLVETTLLNKGDFAIELGNDSPLFVNPQAGNFLLAAGSRAIDSSVDSLRERDALARVKTPIGIGQSAILAPELDLSGQRRVDDPSVAPPAGAGENVFKDRGALDRSDFAGPAAVLVNPVDNDAAGADRDPAVTFVTIPNAPIASFAIQLLDGVPPADPEFGTGADDLSVTANRVKIERNGTLLTLGVDYTFSYDATNDTLRLTSLAGVWPVDSTYVITLDNSASGITDLANNPLQANRLNGLTQFTITLAVAFDFGDAPDPAYPTLLASNGARHRTGDALFLGTSVDSEQNGQPNATATGDGADENGVTFNTSLVRGVDALLTVTASSAGRLDAWVDFNADGDWNDPGEQIFVSQSLVAGANTLSIAKVSKTATLGNTFARFRLSTVGALAPTGEAFDGEVEDYRVTIFANPWQNPVNPLDVNGLGDGASPSDVILIINELDNPQISDPATGRLPVPPVAPFLPPPFLDTNGDGYVSPTDALLIINALDNLSRVVQSSPIGPSDGTGATPLAQVQPISDPFAFETGDATLEDRDSLTAGWAYSVVMPQSSALANDHAGTTQQAMGAGTSATALAAPTAGMTRGEILDAMGNLAESLWWDATRFAERRADQGAEGDQDFDDLANDLSLQWKTN